MVQAKVVKEVKKEAGNQNPASKPSQNDLWGFSNKDTRAIWREVNGVSKKEDKKNITAELAKAAQAASKNGHHTGSGDFYNRLWAGIKEGKIMDGSLYGPTV